MVLARRVKSHILEKVVATLMVFFSVVAIYIMMTALTLQTIDSNVAVIEMLLIILIAILGQTLVLIRIYEQHVQS